MCITPTRNPGNDIVSPYHNHIMYIVRHVQVPIKKMYYAATTLLGMEY